MTRHAAQWYDALRANGVPHKIYWHQGGHGGAPPDDVTNRWFTRYLYDVQNGVEAEPRALVQREDRSLVQYAEWPVPGSVSTPLSLTPVAGRDRWPDPRPGSARECRATSSSATCPTRRWPSWRALPTTTTVSSSPRPH